MKYSSTGVCRGITILLKEEDISIYPMVICKLDSLYRTKDGCPDPLVDPGSQVYYSAWHAVKLYVVFFYILTPSIRSTTFDYHLD